MRRIVLVFCLCLASWCVPSAALAQGGLDQRVSELSQKISNGLTENQKRTIAVVEFADLRGNVTDFGRFIAEELITHLYETKKFKVIERQLLSKVITEQKLSLTGIIDPTSAQKLGRLLGVDAIATGTITDLGKSLRVNARLISTGTGEIFAVAATEIAKDDSVTKLMGASDAGPPSDGDKADQATAAQRIDDLGFTFDLQPCQVSTSMIITCDISIKNNRDDRGFSLEVDGSKLFDELGNSYSAIVARLGNLNGAGPHIDFVAGVTTKARMSFQRLRSPATRITMLQIHFSSFADGRTIKFRDVPLIKSRAPNNGAPLVVAAQEFNFELTSCKLSTGILTCELTITNNASEDKQLGLRAISRIFDELGNDYTASDGQIGTERFRVSGVSSLLVPRIPTKATLKFQNINQTATTITLLRIEFWGSPDFHIDFRNPPLTK